MIRELSDMLDDDVDGLNGDVLNGIVGAVAGMTYESLKSASSLNLTFNQYTTISPAIMDMEKLLSNAALGPFVRTLCILMYKIGQQNAPSLAEENT